MKNYIIVLLITLFNIQISTAQNKSGDKEKVIKEFVEKGNYYLNNEDFYLAEKEFYKALKLRPSDPDINYSFAESCRYNGDYEDAEISYENTVKVGGKKYPYARYWLAMMEKLNGKYYESSKNFEYFFKNHRPKTNDDRAYLKSAFLEQKGCEFAMEQIRKPIKDINLRVIPPPVNSRNTDYAPLIFGHDSLIVITSARADAKGKDLNNTTGEARCDNFRFEKQNDRWVKIEGDDNFHVVNSSKDDGAGELSKDKSKYYYTICDPQCAVYVSKKTNGKFQKPEKLNENINPMGVWNAQPTLSPTMDTMLFVSQREGGKGMHDIWMSVNIDKTGKKEDWDKPTNVKILNTEGIELSPFWDDSTNLIYFASNGQIGLGGLDIFKLSEDRKKVENMGLPYNSSRDDMYMVIGKSRGYLVTNRPGGVGLTDILMFDRKPVVYNLTKVKRGLFKEGEKVTASGKIQFSGFNEAIEGAKIFLKDTLGNVIGTSYSDASGNFIFENIPTDKDLLVTMDESDSRMEITMSFLVDNRNITAKVSKAGMKLSEYQSNSDSVMKKILAKTSSKNILPFDNIIRADATIASADNEKTDSKLYLKDKNLKVVLENIYFDFNSKEITPAYKLLLDDIYDYLIKNKNIKVEIKAFTDGLGGETYNKILADQRAQECLDYLVNKGLDKKILKKVPIGQSNAIGNNDSYIGRQLNRRVEFSVNGADEEYVPKAMVYIVEPHMTISLIAKKFSMTPEDLMALNGMTTPDLKAYAPLRVKNIDNLAVIDPNTIMNMKSGQMEFQFTGQDFVPMSSSAVNIPGIK
ncbi:MAG: OmpA family protein [Bacteroidota bacterium]|nr:OmpA family protein [Bacteroidota bacterium]